MENQFNNDLNSENNLKLTLSYIKELNLKNGISINKTLIDIPPIVTKTKIFFGLFNCNSWSDHITYHLKFDGKIINIIKTTSYDYSYRGEYHQQTLVNIKLKILKELKNE